MTLDVHHISYIVRGTPDKIHLAIYEKEHPKSPLNKGEGEKMKIA